MKVASSRIAPAAALAAMLLVAAGCGGSSQVSGTAANADKKVQVGQVCREFGGELKGLSMPTDRDAAVRTQRASAQIFKTATAKLTALDRNVGLPVSYKSWLDAFKQLFQYNEQAAEAFGKDGITSDEAIEAGQRWEAQAAKANGLARQAGLDSCVVGPPQAG